jgi:PAS domain S-box-containing protein
LKQEYEKELIRLSQVANQTTNGVVITDSSGKVEWINNGFSRLSGYSLEELRGKKPGALLQGVGSNPATVEQMRAAIDAQESFDGEIINYAKDGHPYWVHITCNPLHNPEGNLEGFIAIQSDITRSKEDAERIRESEERLAMVIEGTNIGTWEWNIQTGETKFNERWAEICGYTLAELEPVSIETWLELAHPEDLKKSEAQLQQHFEGELDYYDLQCRMRHKDGCWVWVHDRGRVFSWSDEGLPLMMAGTHADISEQKLAEGLIQENEARKTAIMESALNCIIMIDQAGAVIEWNEAAERTFGHRRERVMGRKMADVIVPERFREAHLAGMERYLKTRQPKVLRQRLELPALRSDGSEFPSEIFISAIELGGAPVFAAYLQDITDRKEAEAELVSAKEAAEAANLAKSEFLANISHEIRTPMMAISGYAEILSEPDGRLHKDVEWAKRIGESAEHLGLLLDDVLDLSRIEAGRLLIEMTECNLRELVQEVVSYFQPLANEKLLDLGVNYRPDVSDKIFTDPTRVRQVLINLVSNALKFTTKGGINIKITQPKGAPEDHDGSMIEIAVSDTGIGIDEERLSEIFLPFVRIENRDQEVGGTGLGLTISQRLAEMIGGRIVVSSRQGEGSTFTLVIPVGTEAEHTAADTPIHSQLSPRDQIQDDLSKLSAGEADALGGLRVLVVDDNEDNEAILRYMLERRGAAVTSSQNGKDGIDRVKNSIAAETPFDVILMDMLMPVMDGYEATRTLRTEGIHTPIIALTAYAMEDDKQRSIDAGCNLVLSKPILSRTLVTAVVDLITGTRSRSGSARHDPSDHPSSRSLSSVPSEQADHEGLQYDALLERYRENLAIRLQAIEDALGSKDVETLLDIVHKVKGTAGMYGYTSLSDCAETCEGLLRGGASIDESMDSINAVKASILSEVKNKK